MAERRNGVELATAMVGVSQAIAHAAQVAAMGSPSTAKPSEIIDLSYELARLNEQLQELTAEAMNTVER